MNACGLIVEYNPFHNGHLYHVQQAKKASNADCMIAVMSGSFLQRGEPAIIDKFHRTKAALASGVDIVLELPYAYAVQSSHLFAKGAVQTLNEIGVDSLCFGSEAGDISDFMESYERFTQEKHAYDETVKMHINNGLSYPEASNKAYEQIGLTNNAIDLSKPNNILGFSYVRSILENHLPIKALTIKRTNNNYHDTTITSTIASATSIRNQLFNGSSHLVDVEPTLPTETLQQLKRYKAQASLWHTLEAYFTIVRYRVMTMHLDELSMIAGMDEGIEHRIKSTAKEVESFEAWIHAVKSKRYTWTRIQRMFVHILTNTRKTDLNSIHNHPTVAYVRLLGMTKNGQAFLNEQKKKMNVPLISALRRNTHQMLAMEEKATNAYYSILPAKAQIKLFKQELQLPIIL